MDAFNNLPLVAAVIASQQLLAAAMTIFDDHPTRYEARMKKKRKRELAPYKRNVSLKVGPPETTLEPVRVFDDILAHDNHEYMRKMTHLHLMELELDVDNFYTPRVLQKSKLTTLDSLFQLVLTAIKIYNYFFLFFSLFFSYVSYSCTLDHQ
jgi:hypothetical protein